MSPLDPAMPTEPTDWPAEREVFTRANQRWLGVREDGKPGTETWGAWERETGETRPEREPIGLTVDRSLRLPADQYIPDSSVPKDLIVLHHTAGGSAKSTFDWWRTTPERIGTAYIVARDGTVHEVFDPRAWAFHLGISGTQGRVDRRSIGIEIASEGGLTEADGKLYTFGVVSPRTEYRGEVVEVPQGWRGFRQFAAYTPAALASVYRLVDELLARFEVPRRMPGTEEAPLDFAGVAGHFHFRRDKSDVHVGFPWGELADVCRLTVA